MLEPGENSHTKTSRNDQLKSRRNSQCNSTEIAMLYSAMAEPIINLLITLNFLALWAVKAFRACVPWQLIEQGVDCYKRLVVIFVWLKLTISSGLWMDYFSDWLFWVISLCAEVRSTHRLITRNKQLRDLTENVTTVGNEQITSMIPYAVFNLRWQTALRNILQ